MHGRLCLEPLHFTLGIFNQMIRRGQARAWRILEYINDLQLFYKNNGEKELHDYHLMLKVLIKSFTESQTNPIAFELIDGTY
jgi:hypothetical protein